MFRRTTCPGRINCRRRLSHVEAIRRVAAASVAYSAEAKTVLASSARLHPYVAAITGLRAVVVSPGDGINHRTHISVVPTPSSWAWHRGGANPSLAPWTYYNGNGLNFPQREHMTRKSHVVRLRMQRGLCNGEFPLPTELNSHAGRSLQRAPLFV